MFLRSLLLASVAAHASAKHVALFGIKRYASDASKDAELDLYAAVSDEVAFAYDAGGTLAGVGCELSGAFNGAVVHADAKLERGTGHTFVIVPAKGAGFPTGLVATIKLPASEAKKTQLVYGGSTWVEPLGGARVELNAKQDLPWVVLVSGEPSAKKTEKSVWVFGSAPHIRSFGLGFANPIKGRVSAASSYTTRSLEVVSAFTASQKIAWGAFSPPFLTPTGTPVGTLTFEKFSLDEIEVTSKDTIVEMEDYSPAPSILLVHAPIDLLHGSAGGKGSGFKAGEWKEAL